MHAAPDAMYNTIERDTPVTVLAWACGCGFECFGDAENCEPKRQKVYGPRKVTPGPGQVVRG